MVIVGCQDQSAPLARAEEMAADISRSRLVVLEELGAHEPAGKAGTRSHGRTQEMVDRMTIVYAREAHLGADEYIDVVAKSGLNRPIEDREIGRGDACWPTPT